MAKPSVGFIGLGTMGGAMCGHLIADGYPVAVWARSREKAQVHLDAGAGWAETPAMLAGECDIVAMCVSDDAAVESVVFGKDGISSGPGEGKLLIDHSTVHPVATREWAYALEIANGMLWMDAPVSGGPGGAARGELIVMAGATAAGYARGAEIAGAYAKQITHMGPVGAGQATKVCNQLIIGAEICAIAEALMFANNFGIDAASLADALKGGWADSPVLQDHGRRMAAADYSDPADASMMAKDMNIACDMGRLTDTAMPVTEQAAALYREAIERGYIACGQIAPMRLYADKPL